MKNSITLLLFCFVVGCTPKYNPQALYYNHFKGQYNEFLSEGEREIQTYYHWMKSRKSNGKYVFRTFFPETKQILSQVEYETNIYTDINKSGPAKYWHENGKLKNNGNVLNGEKTGLWKSYFRENENLAEEGNYKKGMKTDHWKIYDSNGWLKEDRVYIKDKKEGPFTQFDSLGAVVNEGIYKADTLFSQTRKEKENPEQFKIVETMPLYNGCPEIDDYEEKKKCATKAMLEFIYLNIKYPATQRKYGIEGMTVTTFVIDKEGKISEVDVIRGLNQGFKDECYRVVSNMPDWVPGTQGGEKVRVQFNLPIRFKLE